MFHSGMSKDREKMWGYRNSGIGRNITLPEYIGMEHVSEYSSVRRSWEGVHCNFPLIRNHCPSRCSRSLLSPWPGTNIVQNTLRNTSLALGIQKRREIMMIIFTRPPVLWTIMWVRRSSYQGKLWRWVCFFKYRFLCWWECRTMIDMLWSAALMGTWLYSWGMSTIWWVFKIYSRTCTECATARATSYSEICRAWWDGSHSEHGHAALIGQLKPATP